MLPKSNDLTNSYMTLQPESGPRRLLNTAAYMIHSALHIARSDILCAAHTHSIYGKAFSALGIELDMLTQDSCAFYDVSSSPDCHP